MIDVVVIKIFDGIRRFRLPQSTGGLFSRSARSCDFGRSILGGFRAGARQTAKLSNLNGAAAVTAADSQSAVRAGGRCDRR